MKKKNLLQRFVIIAIVTILGLYVVIGPRTSEAARNYFRGGFKDTLANNIHLGLDLKGGSHLVMRVKTEEYLKGIADNNALAASDAAKAAGINVKAARSDISNNAYRFVVEANDGTKMDDLRDAVQKKIDLRDWTASTSGNTITWTLTTAAQRLLAQQAVDQDLKIIESRINSFGVTEPTLQTHGNPNDHQILLQMPGIQDPERVKKLLVTASRLDLGHVVSPQSPSPAQTYATEEEAKTAAGNSPNRRALPYAERDEPSTADANGTDQDKNKPKRWVVVEQPPIVSGSDLRNAQAANGRAGVGGADDYQIDFQLKPTGAEKFGAWTGANVNEYMGVVLDNGQGAEVKSIAFIKSQITDSGQISGRFTQKSAEDLALTLRSGALPAQIEYQEERTVGPSLGADSIRSGIIASIVGLALVIAFMLFYYRGSGVNAVIALLLNMILTMAGLVIFGATLTLPGIAGLILTIGMAVDSNVLIFERIREEMRTGKTIPSAIDQGFSRAFVTIIDTHVTTIVSSLFLFVFGTGPIRGFAVTLILGLLVNLFSAVYVSRTIFIWLLNRKGQRVESLSI